MFFLTKKKHDVGTEQSNSLLLENSSPLSLLRGERLACPGTQAASKACQQVEGMVDWLGRGNTSKGRNCHEHAWGSM